MPYMHCTIIIIITSTHILTRTFTPRISHPLSLTPQ